MYHTQNVPDAVIWEKNKVEARSAPIFLILKIPDRREDYSHDVHIALPRWGSIHKTSPLPPLFLPPPNTDTTNHNQSSQCTTSNDVKRPTDNHLTKSEINVYLLRSLETMAMHHQPATRAMQPPKWISLSLSLSFLVCSPWPGTGGGRVRLRVRRVGGFRVRRWTHPRLLTSPRLGRDSNGVCAGAAIKTLGVERNGTPPSPHLQATCLFLKLCNRTDDAPLTDWLPACLQRVILILRAASRSEVRQVWQQQSGGEPPIPDLGPLPFQTLRQVESAKTSAFKCFPIANTLLVHPWTILRDVRVWVNWSGGFKCH